MTFHSLFDYVKGLVREVTGDKPTCIDEIAESDRRINNNLQAAYERITDPGCPKESLDAATVCLDSITMDFRKRKDTERLNGGVK